MLRTASRTIARWLALASLLAAAAPPAAAQLLGCDAPDAACVVEETRLVYDTTDAIFRSPLSWDSDTDIRLLRALKWPLGEGQRLVQVDLDFRISAEGTLRYENQNVDAGCNATLALAMNISLQPVIAIPGFSAPSLSSSSQSIVSLASFDGFTNYGGPSGATASFLPPDVTYCVQITNPSVLEHFIFGQEPGTYFEFAHAATHIPSYSGCSPASTSTTTEGRIDLDVRYYVCDPPDCPTQTVAGDGTTLAPFTAGRLLDRLHRVRDRVLNGDPRGRGWTRLYYRYADELSRILRASPRLRGQVAALLVTVAPGLEALGADGGPAAERPIPPHAVALLDQVLRGFEDGDVAGELASDLGRLRAALDLGQIAGRSYRSVWERMQTQRPAPSGD